MLDAAEIIKATRAKPHNEAWKFTPLGALNGRRFALGEHKGGKAAHDSGLVFNNGIYAGGGGIPERITIHSLGDDKKTLAAIQNHPILGGHPAARRSLDHAAGGIAMHVAGKIAAPFGLVFAHDGDDTSSHPVLAIDLADGAELTLFEYHRGSGNGIAMPVIAARLGRGATLKHARVQCEDATRHHLATMAVRLAADAEYEGVSVQTGAALSRCENHFNLAGENAAAHLTTLYLARDAQLMDVTTYVNHAAAHCNSMQVVRGVLDDKARGVFQGKVYVAKDAQKTDGNQMSRALLLSRECEADAKPELEIYADDVACSHGATVGEIDETQLFYLMSRGIGEAEARQILIEAFLADALDEVKTGALADFTRPEVMRWLGHKNGKGHVAGHG